MASVLPGDLCSRRLRPKPAHPTPRSLSDTNVIGEARKGERADPVEIIEIPSERNAPALDPIAWYGGNSGEGFALADGRGSARWKELP